MNVIDVLDPVFPIQVRAARGLLGWTQKELASFAGLSEPFVNRLERGERLGRPRQLRQLRQALVSAGVYCYATEDSFGVELRGEAAAQRRRQLEE